ncbi:hypothetical protein BC832DRAFT_620926 [Gaertneriomyces semiglobifer]|nr:hypothetical protein BC832DRAFT_620926 [Gaertneriomyces semiglobifer]
MRLNYSLALLVSLPAVLAQAGQLTSTSSAGQPSTTTTEAPATTTASATTDSPTVVPTLPTSEVLLVSSFDNLKWGGFEYDTMSHDAFAAVESEYECVEAVLDEQSGNLVVTKPIPGNGSISAGSREGVYAWSAGVTALVLVSQLI